MPGASEAYGAIEELLWTTGRADRLRDSVTVTNG
jgi:hypothetical protein